MRRALKHWLNLPTAKRAAHRLCNPPKIRHNRRRLVLAVVLPQRHKVVGLQVHQRADIFGGAGEGVVGRGGKHHWAGVADMRLHCHGDGGLCSQQTEYTKETITIPTIPNNEFTNLIGRTSYPIIGCKNVADSLLINVKLRYEDFNTLALHEKIKVSRIKAGVTSCEMARLIGINQSTYSRYEAGDFCGERVGLEVLEKMEEIWGRA